MTCIEPACGQPRTKHGPPPKGWIFVRPSRTEGAWYCSPACAWAGIATTPPPIAATAPTPRPDVATCPLCTNRHDRDHRCGICNTRPQVVHVADRTVELYHHHTEGRTA
jgi:hypothetical protein